MENPPTTPRATSPSPRATHAPPPQKLRLLISYNGHILPRPHDKTLTYIGGDTRLIICYKTATLQTLIHKIHKTTSFSVSAPFVIKYQLPSEDLDTLVSVSTDEDVEYMIEEYFYNNGLNSEYKLRLFLFPCVSDCEFVESVKSVGSVLLEGSEKSEEVFVRGLNGRLGSCLSFCSNNSLLGLDDDDVIKVKSDVKEEEKKVVVQDVVHDVLESPGFGSVPDSPVVKEEVNYVAVKAVEAPVVVETVKEVVNYVAVQEAKDPAPMVNYVAVQAPVKVVKGEVKEEVNYVALQAPVKVNSEVKEEVSYVAVQAPMVEVKVAANGLGANGLGHRVSSGFDMASPDSVLSDGSLTNPLSKRNPPVIYQDAATQTQYSNNNNGVTSDQNARTQMQQQQIHAATQTQYSDNNINGVTDDQNTRIPMQMQQQQIPDSAYLSSTSTVAVTTTTQTDLQHPQAHPQHPQAHPQHQFIHTTDPSSVNDQNTRIHLQQQQQIHDSAYLTSTTATSTTAATKTDLQHPQAHQQHQFIHTTDPSSINDQNTRIHLQQQQQIHDSALLTSSAAPSTTAATKTDLQHPQVHQQQQFVHTAVPPPQYIHHHPSGAVPMASYYQMYPPQSQHHVPVSALDQRKIVYYMPVISAPPNNQVPTPSSLFTTPRTVQPASIPESPVYRTNSSGASGPQFVQVPSNQHQPQPQYVAYSHLQQPSQAVASSGGTVQPSSKPESPVYRTNSSGASGPQCVQIPSNQYQLQPQYVAYSHIQQPSQAVASSDGTVQPASKPESPVYRTNSSGASGPQCVQVPSNQYQPQPQYVAYSQIQQPSQALASSGGSGGNYAYEFTDLSQPGQLIYYAAQPMPPQSSAQYQTTSSNLPVEGGSHIQMESSMNQQVKTSQP